MPSFFNPIAVSVPYTERVPDPLAHFTHARRLPFPLACRACGREFAIFVPASLAAIDVNQVYGELSDLVVDTCGNHPPVIQRQ